MTRGLPEVAIKVDKTVRYHGRRLLQWGRGLWWPLADRRAMRRPVLIVGCSRAGTTVTYKTLSLARELASLNREAHAFWESLRPAAARGWEGHDLTAADATPEDREAALRYYYRFLGGRRFVDKTNQNGFRIPYLEALFDEPVFVFVKRSPGDNINSLITGWGRPEEYGDWSEGLPAEVRIDGGRYRRWCFFLFRGWRDYVAAPIEEVCARQWQAYNEAVLAARRAIPGERWVEVVYEEILDDAVACFRQLFDRLELRFTNELEAHCRDLVRRPYNAFSTPARDKWRSGPHRERIERVLPAVAETARKLGYTVAR
ncbi:MAG: sulfotransferase [Nitrospirae bacterium]|nr:MAG: sulfotransferase [Nitrospirota bacterium]